MKRKTGSRILTTILIAGLTMSLCACGRTDGNNSGDSGRKDASAIVEDNKADGEEKDPGEAGADKTEAEQDGTGENNAKEDPDEAGADNAKAESDGAEVDSAKEEPDEAKNDTEGAEAGKRTEYPLTVTTYGSDGTELTTTYEKAPEKVLAVYQGSIETLLEIGRAHV